MITVLQFKAKRLCVYLFTLQVSIYCLLALQGRVGIGLTINMMQCTYICLFYQFVPFLFDRAVKLTK